MVFCNIEEIPLFMIEREMFAGGTYYLFTPKNDRKIATVQLRTQMKLESEMDIQIHNKKAYGGDLFVLTDKGAYNWKITRNGKLVCQTNTVNSSKKINIADGEKEEFVLALNVLVIDLISENLAQINFI